MGSDLNLEEIVACTACFRDPGLRLDAERFAMLDPSVCSNCGLAGAAKLNRIRLQHLAHSFFVRGTLQKFSYGAAPRVVFNAAQRTTIPTAAWLEPDVRLLENLLGVGFFEYGPRFWMFGEIEPLKGLRAASSRPQVIARILREYPKVSIEPDQSFYRMRVNPKDPANPSEYDSPPSEVSGRGRLDSPSMPVMYASRDLQVCIHECRATAEDELYIATLQPTRPLALLDLTAVLPEPGFDEFESLDLAVHMLFLAGKHSYRLTREIASAAHGEHFDGLLYPSYFSLLRSGAMPFETTYGIAHRRVPELKDHEMAKIVPNIALFGRPLKEGTAKIIGLNKVVISRVEYGLSFGPVDRYA